jgi:hypothetical protein
LPHTHLVEDNEVELGELGGVPQKTLPIAKNHRAEMNMLGMLAVLDKTIAANTTFQGAVRACRQAQ